MDTYCWIHSTFTLPHRVTGPKADNNGHPGIGPVSYEDEVTYHRYYQWVCFTLFFQAILFLSPRQDRSRFFICIVLHLDDISLIKADSFGKSGRVVKWPG